MRLINVVGTRAVRGEHEALVQWYADHVHQLMAFEALLGAVLYRRVDDDAATPEYLCLYEFANRAAFDAYEHSDVHRNAARDRTQTWGCDGIEIIVRAQYERLYRRRGDVQKQRLHHVQGWQTADGALSSAAERALAAQVSLDESLTLLRAAAKHSPLCEILTLTTLSYLSPVPPAPSLRWQATYRELMQWSR